MQTYTHFPDEIASAASARGRAKVAYCPLLGEDELVYSFVARYALGAGCLPGELVRRRLFGQSPKHMSVLLTGHLSHLAEVLPPGSPCAADLIINHTTYTYHAPFMAASSAGQLWEMMADGWRASPQGWFGSRRAAVPKKPYLAFCPKCVEVDIQAVGEPTWRRAHQLPGVDVCHLHGDCLLIGPWETRHTTALQPCPRDPGQCPPMRRLLPGDIAVEFARQSASLVARRWDFGGRERLHAGVAELASRAGFQRAGRITRLRLEAYMRDKVGDEVMTAFGLTPLSGRSPGALHATHERQTRGFCPPGRYLLLLAVLGATVADLDKAAREADLTAREPIRAAGRGRTRPASPERLARHKEGLLRAMREHPQWRRMDLFKNERLSYGVVTRDDFDWWQRNAPAPSQARRIVDYPKRDRVISEQIRNAASLFERCALPGRKLTQAKILRAAGLSIRFRPDPVRLPRSYTALREAIRTTNQAVQGARA